jgi:hypothetical protein
MLGLRDTRAEKRRDMLGLGVTVHEGFPIDSAVSSPSDPKVRIVFLNMSR